MTRAALGAFAVVVCAGAMVATGLGRSQDATVTVIVYGDTRFTDLSNTTASNPDARRTLVAKIADERPDAILVSGDLPWHGGTPGDYDEFRTETAVWRERHLRLLPAIGNHEFSMCEPADCIERWWGAFPELKGHRWYSADIGPTVRTLSLDTMSSLLDGSEQRAWIDHELTTLPPTVAFVLISLHHPPVADIQTRVTIDHNPRPNEIALGEYLERVAPTMAARIVVVAGHIHNYERIPQGDVMYVVSGGGGAAPAEIDRTPIDAYQHHEFPNFHYLKLTITAHRLQGVMYRLDEPSAPSPHFTEKDRFEIVGR